MPFDAVPSHTMGGRGTLTDTYAAALRTGTACIPPDAVCIRVVRRPMGWFHAQIDENVPAFGPPDELLDAVHRRRDELEASGLDDAAAHNAAMADMRFEERYLEYLRNSDAAHEARARLIDRLEEGEDVTLVCYENTDEKRCHRTVLQEWIDAELST